MNVDKTLEERGSRYGKFTGHARVSQAIQDVMSICYELSHDGCKWKDLDDDMKEALFMIAHKIGRIVNGDPNYADSWIDIAGYATLVANRLEGKEV